MPDRDANLLESWKEIAAFLGRDKRTAMRWAENCAMPVHRYPGLKQARVFAYRHELAVWLESFNRAEVEQVSGKSSTSAAEADGNSAEASHGTPFAVHAVGQDLSVRGRSESPHPPHFPLLPQEVRANSSSVTERGGPQRGYFLASLWQEWRMLGSVTGSLVIVFAVVALLQPGARLAAGPKAASLIQLTDDGQAKENLRTDGRTLFFDEIAGTNRILASTPIRGGPVRLIPTTFANVFLEDVSPDGKTLLGVTFEGIESAGQLWKLPALGGTPKRVGQVRCNTARWSPDASQIACLAGAGLYLVDAEGRVPRLIRTFGAAPSNLIWTPDGHRVRVVLTNEISEASSAWEIDLRASGSSDASADKNLSLHSPCCEDWTWTRDGRNFTYVVARQKDRAHPDLSSQRIYSSTWFGTQRELAINLGMVHSLASGNSESKLFFLMSNADRGELLRFDKREQAFQSYLPGLSAKYLSFSRDGQWLVYAKTKDASLWRTRSDGTQALRIVDAPMEVQLSSWSPDGRQIAFMGKLAGKPWRIYLVGRDGGSPREAAIGDDNQGAPTWSPDSKTIAYGRVECEHDRSCGIFLLNLDTGRAQPLPESETLRTARWSPDGKYIAALQRDTRAVELFDLKGGRWHKLAENMAGDDMSWSKDSKTLYVSCLVGAKPSIDQVRISDRSRSVAVDFIPLQKMPGQLGMWFGLSPDDSPIILHLYTSSEVYALDSNEQ
jgi:Tol biopolymer transport system component